MGLLHSPKAFNAIHGTSYEPQDIREWDKELDVDIVCHGSPCQDFSSAGQGNGGDEGSGTRSSLMYETVRIVRKLNPKYVCWENVKNLLSKKHKHNFDNYIKILDEMGYNSYYKVLNAKDYGVPQNRERVFTVSIRKDLDDGTFEFPVSIPLKKRLKDILEKNVAEKYYLSPERLSKIKLWENRQIENGRGFRFETKTENDVARTVTANNDRPSSTTYIAEKPIRLGGMYDKDGERHQAGGIYDSQGVSPTLDTCSGGNRMPIVKEDTERVIEHNKNPKHQQDLVQDSEGLCRTIPAGTHGSTPHLLKTVVDVQPIKRRRSEYGKEVRKAYESGEIPADEKMRENFIGDDGVMPTLTCSKREQKIAEIKEPKLEFIGGYGDTDRIGDGKTLSRNYPQGNRVYSTDGIATTQTSDGGGLGGKTGLYLEEDPFVVASRGRDIKKLETANQEAKLQQRFEKNKDGCSFTITSFQKDNYVAEPMVDNPLKGKTEYGWHFEQQVYGEDGITRTVKAGGGSGNIPKVVEPNGFVENAYKEFVDKNGYIPDEFNAYNQSDLDGVAPTQSTQCGSTTSSATVLVKDKLPGAYGRNFGSKGKEQDIDGVAQTLCASMGGGGGNVPLVTPAYRIRKLTAKECWRLMNRDDCEYDKAEKAGISQTQLYKIAGNSIVAACPTAIFSQLFGEKKWNKMTIDERTKMVEPKINA